MWSTPLGTAAAYPAVQLQKVGTGRVTHVTSELNPESWVTTWDKREPAE